MVIAYINELIYILEQFGIKVKMFADDVKMYVQMLIVLTRSVYRVPCLHCMTGPRNGS